MITFSVIIPTIGRATLVDTLKSCSDLTKDDEIILVHDGRPSYVAGVEDPWEAAEGLGRMKKLVCKIQVGYWGIPKNGKVEGCWGAGPRTVGMKLAEGSHILFMDDDDVYTPGAFSAIRAKVEKEPGYAHIFSMVYPDGRILPRTHEIQEGNVSSQMGVFPNKPDLLGTWGKRYSGDYDFFASCRFPVLWQTGITICQIKPNRTQT